MRATTTDRDQLCVALQRLEQEVAAGKLAVKADLEFHVAIARATHNPYILRTLTAMTQLLLHSVTVSRARSLAFPGLPEAVVDEHRRVYQHIVAGDPGGARQAMRDHVQAALNRLAVDKSVLEQPL